MTRRIRRAQGFLLALPVAAMAVVVGSAESDASIENKIRVKIGVDRALGSSHIEVASVGNVVALIGIVENDAARQRALKLVRETEGVRKVHDELNVVPGPIVIVPAAEEPAGTPPADPDESIVSAVRTRLTAEREVGSDHIRVETEGGVVILSGTVRSAEEREQALRAALETRGVERVENRLEVASS